MSMPNTQENVFITDDDGTTIFIRGRASVDLRGIPMIKVWAGQFLPDRTLIPSDYYMLQGNPSLGDRAVYWMQYKEANTDYYLFVVDNYSSGSGT